MTNQKDNPTTTRTAGDAAERDLAVAIYGSVKYGQWGPDDIRSALRSRGLCCVAAGGVTTKHEYIVNGVLKVCHRSCTLHPKPASEPSSAALNYAAYGPTSKPAPLPAGAAGEEWGTCCAYPKSRHCTEVSTQLAQAECESAGFVHHPFTATPVASPAEEPPLTARLPNDAIEAALRYQGTPENLDEWSKTLAAHSCAAGEVETTGVLPTANEPPAVVAEDRATRAAEEFSYLIPSDVRSTVVASIARHIRSAYADQTAELERLRDLTKREPYPFILALKRQLTEAKAEAERLKAQ
jgi:hypothetical protein